MQGAKGTEGEVAGEAWEHPGWAALPLGDRVARLRRRKGWSQTKLGVLCDGFSADYISKIERGVRMVESRATIELLARALQVPVAVLAGALASLHSGPWRPEIAPPFPHPPVPLH